MPVASGLRLIPVGLRRSSRWPADPLVFQTGVRGGVRRVVAGAGVQPGNNRQRHRCAGADAGGVGPAGVGGHRRRRRPGGRRAGRRGRAASTRRDYVQVFKGFHRFLQARKAAEIEAAFGVRLVCPVDEFNASRHVGDDSPALLPPPTPERVAEFFDFLKDRIATARKYAPAARDYALFRTLYHAGLRSEEAALLERAGRAFRPRARSASCMCGSARGPTRPGRGRGGCRCSTAWTWCCAGSSRMCAAKFPDSPVLFADESGGALHRGTIRNRLRYLMELEGRPATERFSPHALRRACATHNYERGVDLVAIQQLLGHWTVSSTMRYVPAVGDVHRGRLSPRGLFDAGAN